MIPEECKAQMPLDLSVITVPDYGATSNYSKVTARMISTDKFPYLINWCLSPLETGTRFAGFDLTWHDPVKNQDYVKTYGDMYFPSQDCTHSFTTDQEINRMRFYYKAEEMLGFSIETMDGVQHDIVVNGFDENVELNSGWYTLPGRLIGFQVELQDRVGPDQRIVSIIAFVNKCICPDSVYTNLFAPDDIEVSYSPTGVYPETHPFSY
jgi:hypothetical protein